MLRRIKLIIASAMVLTVGLSGAIPVAYAATAAQNGSSNGMRISPVRTDLVMNPGQTKTTNVTLANVTAIDATYNVITNDFTAKDETGAPSLLLNGNANAQHGLKNYMSVPKTVSVAAGQQKEVTVTITLPGSIAGGGYYGAVRFVPTGTNKNASNVSLSGSVASLILVSVAGKVTDNLQIASFSAEHGSSTGSFFTTNKDLKALVRFRNAGNVQEQPFGKILLKKGSKTLGSYEINNSDPRGNVLPDSIRRFEVPLKGVGSFGKYKLEGNFGFGQNGQLLSASTTFYVVPLALLIVVIVIVILLVILLVAGPRAIKRYNQRILRGAGRR